MKMLPNFISVLGISVLVFSLTSCKDNVEKSPEKRLRPVRYITVSHDTGETVRSFSGITQAGTVAKVSFRVSGKVEKLFARKGDVVKKGAALASLDPSDADLQLSQAQSAVRKSKVYRDTATSNLMRIRKLYENNTVSLNEYEAAKENLANAKATYLSDLKNLELKEKELGYFKLYSPIDGVVAGVVVEDGENISTGQVIMEIHSGDELEVEVGIPDSFITEMKRGGQVSLSFLHITDRLFKGIISEVSYTIDVDSSTYPVTISIIEPTGAIRPGMAATVKVSLQNTKKESSLTVPTYAVGEDSEGNFVFLVKKTGAGTGVVVRKAVVVGNMSSNGFEILSGLEPGDLLVTAGIVHLSDGLEVKLQ